VRHEVAGYSHCFSCGESFTVSCFGGREVQWDLFVVRLKASELLVTGSLKMRKY